MDRPSGLFVLSILLSVLRITSSNYPFGLIRRFVYSIVCPSSYDIFWLPLWFHQTFCLFYCLSFVLWLLTTPLVSSDVLSILLSVLLRIHLLTTPLVSSDALSILLSVLLITSSNYPFGFIRRFVYSIVFPSYYVFWLPLWSH